MKLFNKNSDKPKNSIAASFKTRSFRAGGYSAVATAIVIAIAVLVNVIVGALPVKYTQLDITPDGLYSISEQTETMVKELQDEITIYWIVQSGQEDVTLENMLNQYKSLGSKINVVVKDPDVYPTFLRQYEVSSVYNNSLIVENGDKYRYVDFYDIYVYDYSNYYYDGSYSVSFAGESEITSAIDYVTSDSLPKVYILSGHGEYDMPTNVSTALSRENIETQQLSLLTVEAVPEDADAVFVVSPQSDISVQESEMLAEYLKSGGNMLLITDPLQDGVTLENLKNLMSTYGVGMTDGIVMEGSQNNYVWNTPYYLMPKITSHTVTSPLIDANYSVIMPVSHGITVFDTLPENTSVTQLLKTSSSAYSKMAGYSLSTYEKEEGDIEGDFALAVAITETFDDETQSNIVWFSSSSILSDESNTLASGANHDLFLNCVNWMCQKEESSITIHAKTLTNEYLTMSNSVASMLTFIVVVFIPLCYLGAGIYVWARRRRR